MYGREVILDVAGADVSKFQRRNIRAYLEDLCDKLGLERADLHFWGYDDAAERAKAPAHLQGESAVQFVTTSSIVVHTLDATRQVLINVFGCGEIDGQCVVNTTLDHFGGYVHQYKEQERGL